MSSVKFVKKCIENNTLREAGFREALIAMRGESISKEDAEFFKNAYFSMKENENRTLVRNMILGALVLQCLQYGDINLKEFFLQAAKKAQYLDMRLTAIRGYSAYATEAEVSPLMDKFYSVLIKRPEHTPLNYQEYEMLRSKFGLPYLVERYGYDCFKRAMEQLEKQYNDMHDGVKGIFTLDEKGISVILKSPGEAQKGLDAALGRK